MSDDIKCPKCGSEAVYPEGTLWICPECDYEWMPKAKVSAPVEAAPVEAGIKDAYGNFLRDGDAVTVIKDLKVKGSSS